MDNPFPYSRDNKRYRAYGAYLKERFGKRVIKIPLNAGFSCPNRDGAKGRGGCAFCSGALSGDFAGDPARSLREQYDQVRESYSGKWSGLCIPYFQAGSNTYGDVGRLRELFYGALELPEAVGLAVATRADCIDREKARLLGELAGKTYLTVELGLQSVYDTTARAMNRCHSCEDFLRGFELLREQGVGVCVHLIDGLPGEDGDMMRASAEQVGRLRPHGVKLHLLHVLRGTRLAQMYERGEFSCLTREEYVGIICDQLELLPQETVIERLTGDGAREELIAPLWSRDKRMTLNCIDMELARRDSFQGRLFDR